jgi:triacylglycerol lipase
VFPSLGRPWTLLIVAAAITPLVPMAAVPAAPATDSGRRGEGPGPAMLTARFARFDALACSGALDAAPRGPVLLVPGTAISAADNWGPTYLPVLLERGHAVCTVDLPDYATRNVEEGAEYVATAIRRMAGASTRPISLIGHSQGAYLPRVALRTWPDLTAHVDDLIGLAGVYDRGSQALRGRCRLRCMPVLHQLASGSRFLARMSGLRLPPGPSYTNIGTLGDLTITPQPAANQQPGATSIMVQDVCPGRTMPIAEHAMIAGDAAALALALDALDHPGPALPDRIDPAVCERQQFPEFDSLRFLAATTLTSTRAGTSASEEPAPYCRRMPTCRQPRLRGFVTTATRYAVRRDGITVRTRVRLPGRIRVTLGGRSVSRTVTPGRVTLRIRRPDRAARLLVKALPRHFTSWAVEGSRRVGRGIP